MEVVGHTVLARRRLVETAAGGRHQPNFLAHGLRDALRRGRSRHHHVDLGGQRKGRLHVVLQVDIVPAVDPDAEALLRLGDLLLALLIEEVHRSEEHTSELQSLMRISYAVFCLKKKNNNLSYSIYYN